MKISHIIYILYFYSLAEIALISDNTQFVEINGHKLRIVHIIHELGSKVPLVVFIHGLGGQVILVRRRKNKGVGGTQLFFFLLFLGY
jgi:hypothetical protein